MRKHVEVGYKVGTGRRWEIKVLTIYALTVFKK